MTERELFEGALVALVTGLDAGDDELLRSAAEVVLRSWRPYVEAALRDPQQWMEPLRLPRRMIH